MTRGRDKDRFTLLSFSENSGPPCLYIKSPDGDSLLSEVKTPEISIQIAGRTTTHLNYYAWRQENILVHDYFGLCCLSKPQVCYRLVAKLQNGHLITGYVVKRIWTTIQTESGDVYTLGKEIEAKDIRVI